MSSASSALSSPFQLFTTKIPNSSFNPKTLSSSSFPKHPNFSSFFRRPITFQRIPTIISSPLHPHHLYNPKTSPRHAFRYSQPLPIRTRPTSQVQSALALRKQPQTTQDNKVLGCLSQVWVRAYLDSDENVFFEANSDSRFSKGLAALLIIGLSGEPVERILKKAKVLELNSQVGSQEILNLGSKIIDDGIEGCSGVAAQLSEEKSNGGIGSVKVESTSEENVAELEGVSESNSGELGSLGKRIKETLKRGLSPVKLEVEEHAGHAGVRGSGGNGQMHFNVEVVPEEFEGKSMIKRHRLVYTLLQEELQSGLHALSIVAKTPAEVEVVRF